MSPSQPSAKPGHGDAFPAAADIRGQLERILNSPSFAASTLRRALLQFLIDETLAGRADRLKGFTIAVAVFGRDETFDAQTDPIVRLEARRLRRDLDGYYASAGADDPVRISIPKGAYVASLERQDAKTPSASPLPAMEAKSETLVGIVADVPLDAIGTHPTTAETVEKESTATGRGFFRLIIPTLLGIAIILVAVGVWLWNERLHESLETAKIELEERGPSVIVLPFESLSAREDDRFLAAGITQQLITDLVRFAAFKLYSVQASFRQDASAEPGDLGRSMGVAYVVKGSLRSSAGTVRLSASLLDSHSGQVLWSENYDRPLTPDNLLDVQENLSAKIATLLAQPYGVINDAIATRLRKEPPRTMFAYGCVVRAFTYRATFSRELYSSTRACLEEAVRVDPTYADAFALLAWLHLDAARYRFLPEKDAPGEMEQARTLAERAVKLAPKQPLSLQALAAVSYYRGEFDKAERLQREALVLNPNDPEVSAQLGWRLAFRGRWDEGLGYLTRAIERSLSPPAWYHTSPAMHAYLQGNYAEALVEAEQTRATFSGIGQSLYAMIQAALGNQDEAKKALDELAVRVPHFARDPAGALRIHHLDETIIDRLVNGLRKAGWKESDAPQPGAE